MPKQCECNHKCRCGDVWACILKPFKILFFIYIALSCIGEINRHPQDFIMLLKGFLMVVACILGACILAGGIAAAWNVAKAFRELKTTSDGRQP